LKWKARIERAKNDGGFTHKDIEKAQQWASCAVGERLGLDPKAKNYDIDAWLHEHHKPLVNNGSLFFIAVKHGGHEGAKIMYDNIEAYCKGRKIKVPAEFLKGAKE